MSRWVRYEGPADEQDELTGLPRAGGSRRVLTSWDLAARRAGEQQRAAREVLDLDRRAVVGTLAQCHVRVLDRSGSRNERDQGGASRRTAAHQPGVRVAEPG